MKVEQIVCVDPEIMSGTSVFAGTGAPVQSLIAHILASASLADFLEGFPTVTRR